MCLLRYAGAAQISVTAQPGAHLLGREGREIASGSGPWTFSVTAKDVNTSNGKDGVQVTDAKGKRLSVLEAAQHWRVQLDDGAAQIGLRGSGSATRHYHGSLEIRVASGQLRLINEVCMEPYLQGVVISEIGDGPLEALKAQVIAARTYAISSRGRWKADGYDLRDSVDSQAYNGIEAETPEGNRAVRETTGQILTVNGQPIDSDFCDDCGGVTAPGDDPAILPRSVSDAEAHRNIRRAPYTNWTLSLSPERLKALLSSNAKARGVGTLQSVEIAQRDVSGRAQRVRMLWGVGRAPAAQPTDSDSKPDSKGGSDSRSTLPSRHLSRRHTDDQNSRDDSSGNASAVTAATELDGEHFRATVGYNILRSTLFTVHRAANGDFVFEGHGWGHGHGLCQQGALALAAPPLNQNSKTILAHYYPGARLTFWQAAEEEGLPHGG